MATYRQQTGSSLTNITNCLSCYTTLSLCYSSTSASDVCCSSMTSVTVYVPAGETFANANNLYATAALSGGSLAAAGYYSADGACTA